jgi:hypothetical protein
MERKGNSSLIDFVTLDEGGENRDGLPWLTQSGQHCSFHSKWRLDLQGRFPKPFQFPRVPCGNRPFVLRCHVEINPLASSVQWPFAWNELRLSINMGPLRHPHFVRTPQARWQRICKYLCAPVSNENVDTSRSSSRRHGNSRNPSQLLGTSSLTSGCAPVATGSKLARFSIPMDARTGSICSITGTSRQLSGTETQSIRDMFSV